MWAEDLTIDQVAKKLRGLAKRTDHVPPAYRAALFERAANEISKQGET